MMPANIEDVLAFEVKKELADRYFGFRKIIEEDKEDIDAGIKGLTVLLEQQISTSLFRIYILLKDEDLIQSFSELAGLEERILFDGYITESPTLRQKVFEGVTPRGLTRAGRFKNLFIDSYDRLTEQILEYRGQWTELLEQIKAANESIDYFYRKHDLANIMRFLRSLDCCDAGMEGLASGPAENFCANYSRCLQVKRLPPLQETLPFIPPLVPLPNIRSSLKKLLDIAYKRHGALFKHGILR